MNSNYTLWTIKSVDRDIDFRYNSGLLCSVVLQLYAKVSEERTASIINPVQMIIYSPWP
jgi:hypothetical protein